MARGEPMSMSAGAATRRKPPKELDHIRVHEGESGGHVIEHHFTHVEHEPERHVFGEGQHKEAHDHIAKHMNMPMPKVAKVKKSTEAGEREKEESEEEEKMAAAD